MILLSNKIHSKRKAAKRTNQQIEGITSHYLSIPQYYEYAIKAYHLPNIFCSKRNRERLMIYSLVAWESIEGMGRPRNTRPQNGLAVQNILVSECMRWMISKKKTAAVFGRTKVKRQGKVRRKRRRTRILDNFHLLRLPVVFLRSK